MVKADTAGGTGDGVQVIADGRGREYHGRELGSGAFSLIWVEAAPGEGPRLHRHAYEEMFVVVEGEATFTAGEEMVRAGAGTVVVVPAGMPHRFVNTGTTTLRQIDVHGADRIVTEWLEEPQP